MLKGTKHSPETLIKLRESHLGQISYWKGKKMPFDAWNKGKIMNPITKEKMRATKISQCLKGSKASCWKGGKIIVDGYYYIYSITHPYRTKLNYVAEHRLTMEKKLNRFLLPEERVHHIDGNKLNNHIDNLMYFKNESDHQKYHHPKNGMSFRKTARIAKIKDLM